MSMIDKYQTATYWGAPVNDGYGGHTFAAPVALQVRWEEKAEEFVSTQGEPIFSQASVWTDIDTEIGGYLYLGSSVAADPTSVDNAYPIKRFAKTPDLRNIEYERRSWL